MHDRTRWSFTANGCDDRVVVREARKFRSPASRLFASACRDERVSASGLLGGLAPETNDLALNLSLFLSERHRQQLADHQQRLSV